MAELLQRGRSLLQTVFVFVFDLEPDGLLFGVAFGIA
jgi:hypothetical protein